MSHGIQLRALPYDHPDALELNDQVQLEYQARYGGEGDVTPLDPAMFAPPNGLYLLAYDATGAPIASGGWRGQEENDEGYSDGDAELKRMYVVPEAAAWAWPAASWPNWKPMPARPAAPAWSWKRETSSRKR